MNQRILPTLSSMTDAYRDDLAFIHDDGFGAVARDAAARLVTELEMAAHPSGVVVDLGCGSGILARILGEAGYHVIGIDVSEAMIALARQCAPLGEFRVGSFVTTGIPSAVAVAATGEVLNYGFDSENNERTRVDLFRRAYEALVPGGILLFDVAGPDRAPVGELRRTFVEGPGWVVLTETTAEPSRRSLVRHITTFRQVGALYRRDRELHTVALLDPSRILELLKATGFEARVLDGYGRLPFPPGIVAFLAKKPSRRDAGS